MDAAPRSKPVTSVRRPLDVFERIDALPPEASGAFLYGDPDRPVGTVLVERGRVCWAAVEGMGRRLTDLVREASLGGVDASRIEAIYTMCREQRTPLADALIAGGVVSEEGFRNVLRHYTTEALLQIAATGETRRAWVEKEGGYAALVTFSTLDLVVCVGELYYGEHATTAIAVLSEVLPSEAKGLAFMKTKGRAGVMPIAELRCAHMRLFEAGALGKWASTAIDTGARLGGQRPSVTVEGEGGESLVVWAAGPMIFAALCEDRASRAWVDVKLARARKQDMSPSDA